MVQRMMVVSVLALAGACGDSGSLKQQAGASSDGGNPFHNSNSKTSADSGSERDGSSTSGCGAEPFDAAPLMANVLLVIDKSGSMSDMPKNFDSDKWTAMKASVPAALSPVKDRMRIGLELYPMAGCDLPGGSDIDVDVQPGGKALPLVTKALAAADPSGGTPTAAALARALAYFKSGAGSKLDGGKYVLLATDGGPNCNDALSCEAAACTVNLDGACPMSVANCCDEMLAGPGAQSGCLDDAETLARITALKDAGVDTFVVGIPGSEAYGAALDAFAKGGGRVSPHAPPGYYQVSASGSAASGLTTVLEAITSGLIKSCRLQLGAVPPALDKLNVEIDGTPVAMNGADGWKLDESTTPPTIELQGKTCQHVEQDGAQSVSITFGCPTVLE